MQGWCRGMWDRAQGRDAHAHTPMSTPAHSSSEVSGPQKGSAPFSDPGEQSQMLTQQHDAGGWESPCHPV